MPQRSQPSTPSLRPSTLSIPSTILRWVNLGLQLQESLETNHHRLSQQTTPQEHAWIEWWSLRETRVPRLSERMIMMSQWVWHHPPTMVRLTVRANGAKWLKKATLLLTMRVQSCWKTSQSLEEKAVLTTTALAMVWDTTTVEYSRILEISTKLTIGLLPQITLCLTASRPTFLKSYSILIGQQLVTMQ